jgi:hypothetical protein
VMRSVGADTAMTVTDGLIGIAMAVVIGAVLAAALAVALSPIRFGPTRAVEPSARLSVDWTAVGLGALVLVVVLIGLAAAISYVGAPHHERTLRGRSAVGGRGGLTAGAFAQLPIAVAAGIRFALDPGRGRSAVPVRSAIIGLALSVTVVAASLTFGDSLDTLVSHPALYGWNWNYLVESNSGYGDIPQAQIAPMLDSDPDVSGWTGVYFGSLLFDGQAVPVLGGTPKASVAPPLLAGHSVEAANQVVLGRETMLQLHKQVGDTVLVSGGTRSERLKIVGEATMPAVGIAFGLHLSVGTGAVVDYNLIPATARNIQGGHTIGPNAVFIRFSNKVSTATAVASVYRIANTIDTKTQGSAGLFVYGVLLPAEIINYKTMGSIPTFLAAGLAAGAVFGLGLTLTASVRRRRHDLALLKALGFTHRQLFVTVGWQATVSAVIGTIVGLPLGIALGRSLWDLFARELFVIPASSVPVLAIVLVAVGAIVLANLVAAVPGRAAARTPVALVLRSE